MNGSAVTAAEDLATDLASDRAVGRASDSGGGVDVVVIERRLVARRRAMTAVMAEVLDLVAALDVAEPHPTASPNAASWLAWNLGLSGRESRRWVRLARRLADLPVLRAAFAGGRVTYEQVLVLVDHATSDNQADLVELAATVGSVDELRAKLRDSAPPDPAPDEPPPPAVLHAWWNDDRLHVRGSVAGTDGVVVEQALLRLGAKAPKDPASGMFRDPDERAGEALVQMASEAIAADGDHDLATVVIHLDAHDLTSGHGAGWDAAGRLFARPVLDRLLCDARIQPALRDPSGVTVGVGRVTRKIAPWLRRALQARDQGCRFPGCGRTRWLHGHHLIAWSAGGPTNLDNLISLCGFHHRLIHNQQWQIHGTPTADLTFVNQHGRIHRPHIGRYPPDWTDQLLQLITHQSHQRHAQLAARTPP